jgi:hypothetical protein
MSSYASTHGASRPSARTSLWQRLRGVFSPVLADDWTQPDPGFADLREPKALPPAMERPAGHGPEFVPGDPHGHGHTQSFQVPPQSLPFAVPTSAPTAHIAIRMLHKWLDIYTDPSMTAVRAIELVQALDRELSEMAQAEVLAEKRARRNAAEAAQHAELLAAAARRNEQILPGTLNGDQFVASVSARAVRIGDPTPTGVVPRITADMPDPRVAAAVAEPGLRQSDVNPGDPELAASPLHSADTDTIPAVPEAAPRPFPLQRRSTEDAPTAPDPDATQLMPKVADTAVMPIAEALESTAGGAR